MSSFPLGVTAAVTAPLIMTIGFIIWDNHWSGSTYALNLFKCCLASTWFLIVSIATRCVSTVNESADACDPFPKEIFTIEAVGFLVLSSILGIVVGDFLWLEALRLLGARRVIVVDTVKPFLAAFMGWAILGENLRVAALGGVLLTVTGVVIVSLERAQRSKGDTELSEVQTISGVDVDVDVDASPDPLESLPLPTKGNGSAIEPSSLDLPESESQGFKGNHAEAPHATSSLEPDIQDGGVLTQPPRHSSLRESRSNTVSSLRQGYVMAVLNVVLDTYGSVLTKQWGSRMSTWEISLIRFGFAGAIMLLLSMAMSVQSRFLLFHSEAIKDNQETPWYKLPNHMARSAWLYTVIGVALVTFITPALSNYALFQVALALALTLGSVGPIYALPLSWLLQNDKPTIRASVGATLAVAGVILLSFFGTAT